MSFIGGVLDSINGDSKSPRQPQPQAHVGARSDRPKPTTAGIEARALHRKRKADGDLQRAGEKAVKPASAPNGTARQSSASTSFDAARKKDTEAKTKHAVVSSAHPKSAVLARALPTPSASPKPSVPAPTTQAQPPGGRFSQLLAKARENQANAVHIGEIKHKPVERLSKEERRALRLGAKGKRGAGVHQVKRAEEKHRRKIGIRKEPAGSGLDEKEKVRVSAKDTGYKGTARPVRGGTEYKGTARGPQGDRKPLASGRGPGDSTRSSSVFDRSRSSSAALPAAKKGRHSYSDEEDEEDDYESDVSSDMEAAAFEVEEEEDKSLRTARKEDDEALREELELKKAKEARKKRLEAMSRRRR
ncbi:MAG: hypothetical protein M1817_002428 [Caeruleum heppii]|nr:MAG: hypothetical protein M1817_002428 [Caeruleum heppii]